MVSITEQPVALITGSSTGIGEAIARMLALQGYRVVINSRTLERAQAVANQFIAEGHDALPVAADVSNADDIENMFTTVMSRLGRVDVLVNNAGAGAIGDSMTYPLRKWNRILALNLTAPFVCSQYAAPSMRENGGGVIVNIGSVYSVIAAASRAAYISSKHGLIGLTKALAVEWAPYNIRVVAVAPSYITTDMVEKATLAGHFDLAATAERTPAGRLGAPEDVAEAVSFVVSERARFITGSVLYVDGGWLAFGGA